VIATTAGRVLASIPSRKLAPIYAFDEMTMSDRLLAFDGYHGVSVYSVPDGRFLRFVAAPKPLRYDEYAVVVGDRHVVFWTSERAIAVDVATGRSQPVENVASPVPGADPFWAITALAVDHDTVYWARTAGGRSFVHSLRLR